MKGALFFSHYIINSNDFTKTDAFGTFGLGNRMYADNGTGGDAFHTMPMFLGSTGFEPSAAVNNIKIQASTGNIEVGSKFTLYGLKQWRN